MQSQPPERRSAIRIVIEETGIGRQNQAPVPPPAPAPAPDPALAPWLAANGDALPAAQRARTRTASCCRAWTP